MFSVAAPIIRAPNDPSVFVINKSPL